MKKLTSILAGLGLAALTGCFPIGPSNPTPTPVPTPTPGQVTLINSTITPTLAVAPDATNPPQFTALQIVGTAQSALSVVANKPVTITVTAPGGNSPNIRAIVGGQIVVQPASGNAQTQLTFTPFSAAVLQVAVTATQGAVAGQQFGIVAVQ